MAAITILPMIRRPMTKPDINIITATLIFALAALAIMVFKQNCISLIGLLAAGQLFAINVNCPMWTMKVKPGAVTPSTIEYKNRDLLSAFQKSSEPYRVATDFENLGGYWNAAWRVWRVENIGGFEPIRSEKYINTVTEELSTWHNERLFNTVKLDSPLIKLLNLKYLIGRSDHPPNPLPPQWRKVREGFHEVYENLGFQPRYLVVPMESVNVNSHAGTAKYTPGNAKAGRVQCLNYQPGSAKLQVEVLPSSAFLFISERNYRGWEITVDGQTMEPLTVNELFIGIPVTKGQHLVRLQFRMPHRNLIILLTAIGICLSCAAMVWGKRS